MAAGFRIGEADYEFPATFRMCDPVLVEEVTGLDFAEFAERIDEMNEAIAGGEPGSDVKALLGLVAVGVWQANPRWKRDRVVRFMQDADMQALTVDEAADDPPPKGAQAPAKDSPVTSDESTSTQEHSEEKDPG